MSATPTVQESTDSLFSNYYNQIVTNFSSKQSTNFTNIFNNPNSSKFTQCRLVRNSFTIPETTAIHSRVKRVNLLFFEQQEFFVLNYEPKAAAISLFNDKNVQLFVSKNDEELNIAQKFKKAASKLQLPILTEVVYQSVEQLPLQYWERTGYNNKVESFYNNLHMRLHDVFTRMIKTDYRDLKNLSLIELGCGKALFLKKCRETAATSMMVNAIGIDFNISSFKGYFDVCDCLLLLEMPEDVTSIPKNQTRSAYIFTPEKLGYFNHIKNQIENITISSSDLEKLKNNLHIQTYDYYLLLNVPEGNDLETFKTTQKNPAYIISKDSLHYFDPVTKVLKKISIGDDECRSHLYHYWYGKKSPEDGQPLFIKDVQQQLMDDLQLNNRELSQELAYTEFAQRKAKPLPASLYNFFKDANILKNNKYYIYYDLKDCDYVNNRSAFELTVNNLNTIAQETGHRISKPDNYTKSQDNLRLLNEKITTDWDPKHVFTGNADHKKTAIVLLCGFLTRSVTDNSVSALRILQNLYPFVEGILWSGISPPLLYAKVLERMFLFTAVNYNSIELNATEQHPVVHYELKKMPHRDRINRAISEINRNGRLNLSYEPETDLILQLLGTQDNCLKAVSSIALVYSKLLDCSEMFKQEVFPNLQTIYIAKDDKTINDGPAIQAVKNEMPNVAIKKIDNQINNEIPFFSIEELESYCPTT